MTVFINLDRDGALERFSKKYEELYERKKKDFSLIELIHEFNDEEACLDVPKEEEEETLDAKYEAWLSDHCPEWTPDVHPYWEGE